MKVAKLIKLSTDLNKLKLTHSTMDIVLAQWHRVRFSASGFRFNDSAAPWKYGLIMSNEPIWYWLVASW